MKALMLLTLALSIGEATEPTGTLTLACQETATDKNNLTEPASPKPVSMGLILDFASKTVAGLERVFPNFSAAVVKIISVDDTSIGYSGNDGQGGAVFGQIDRITGDIEAATERWNNETNKLEWATGYLLQCKPTQRLF